MADDVNIREYSRSVFIGGRSWENIDRGALLRIADAVEKVAKRYEDLLDAARLERDYRLRAEESLATERRRTAALRGIVKRQKGRA